MERSVRITAPVLRVGEHKFLITHLVFSFNKSSYVGRGHTWSRVRAVKR
jgi:hypothetical protein